MGLERWVDHCDICYFAWMIAHLRKTAVPIFSRLVNHLQFSIMLVTKLGRSTVCYMRGSFHLMFFQLHLQPHLHLRHVTLTDAHNNNSESLRKCCIMSGIVHWRSKDL